MQGEFFLDDLIGPKGTYALFHLRSSGPGKNDHRLIGFETVDLLQDRDPIHLRHIQIQHHDIGMFSAKEFQALSTTIGEYHVIALPTEEGVQEISDACSSSITRTLAMVPPETL
jgi:hypothetical protein